MVITARPYRDKSDLAAMKRLVVARRASEPQSGYMHVGDIDWRLFGPHGFPLSELVRLWEDDGELAAWALLSSEGVDYQAHLAHRTAVLEHEILAWGEEQTYRWRRAHGQEPRCIIECFEGDEERARLLRERGYQRTDRGGVHFERSLRTSIDKPSVPDGWAVRGLRHDDVESRAVTQFEAFSPGSKTTPETFRSLMAEAPGYDSDLDSVVVTPDGTVVAAALAWLDGENRVGEFEPVGTRPAYQRRGLARAALLRGLATMRDRGMETAIVQTNVTNHAAIAAYQSVGFAIAGRSREYERCAGAA